MTNRRERPWPGAILCLVAATLFATVTAAQAPPEAPLPAPPTGYESEQIGPITWTFPISERARVVPLIESVEKHWADVANDFGVLVDQHLTIRVARNPREMQALSPIGYPPPDYATGVAYPPWGVILLTMSAPDTWQPPDLEVVLVHELSHVALFRAVDGHGVPRWFSEGVAIQQSEVRLLPRMQSLLRAAAERSMLRLSELSDRFPNRPHDVNVAYAQSADVVGFLRRTPNDERRFHRLIQSMRAGETFDTALSKAYGWTSIGLEREWRESLRKRYRIVPALLGGTTIWVLAAILVLVAYRRRRRYHHLKLQQMGYREELEAAASSTLPPPMPEAETDAVSDAGVPLVEHDGESHTLH
ncbi:MAG: peptidase MA family metallohydrolase [Myxococcales bacterium]|nr:peptidase MA family metallohydrolase [Myxococcales bacterium]